MNYKEMDMRSIVKDILEVVYEEVCEEQYCTQRSISNEWHSWAEMSLMSEDGRQKAPSDMRMMMNYYFKSGFRHYGFEAFFKDLYKDINKVAEDILRKTEYRILNAMDGKFFTTSNWNEVVNMVAWSLQDIQYNIEKDIQLKEKQYDKYEEQLNRLAKEIDTFLPLKSLLFHSKKEGLLNQYKDLLIDMCILRTKVSRVMAHLHNLT